ncbi:hypothetical protein FRC08_010348 [Ceratobasidium sp. 394]|nr:hypothetical protein FRC08_010348 [Ceratobasidium sp. 394]
MAANNVFHLPELAAAVLSFLLLYENAVVLSVSRACFDAGKRNVWRHLDDPDVLFQLTLDAPLPSVFDKAEPLQVVEIPCPMSERAIARFVEYASVVQSVTYPAPWRFLYFNWRGFNALSGVRQHLHIREICLRGNDSRHPQGPTSEDLLAFLQLFIGPATTSLCFLGTPDLNVQHVTASLQCALDNDAPLEHVSVFKHMPHRLLSQADRSIADLLHGFHRLTTLSVCARWLNGHLLGVARLLPRLEVLDVRDFRTNQFSNLWAGLTTDFESSAEGFPSLAELTLRGLLANDIRNLLLIDPWLVVRISARHVQLCITVGPGRQVVDEAVVREIFDVLADRAVRLRSLTFAYPSNDWTHRIAHDTFSRLYGLDLQRLTLDNVSVETGEEGFAFDGRWPRLAHLALFNQAVGPRGLVRFAQLGGLQFLSLYLLRPEAQDLDFFSDQTFEYVRRGRVAEGLTLRCTAPGFGAVQPAVLERYARFLRRLWPDLTVVMRCTDDEEENRFEEYWSDEEEEPVSGSEGGTAYEIDDVFPDDGDTVLWVHQLAQLTNFA